MQTDKTKVFERFLKRAILFGCLYFYAPIAAAHWTDNPLSITRFLSVETAGLIRPPKTLTDPQATDEAKSLMSFLVDQYGQKVLSGQQDMSEINYIFSTTGKQPAIGVFDLIDYSPSRIEFGANPTGQVESWIGWANTGGGIVSLSWHWNAPTDLLNTEDQPWWRGFYTEATTFDIEAVLADPNGFRYDLLIRDLDAISAELTKFQNAGLPVLWRPLHEASGGWFWWGDKGPGPFIELWRLMHDRFINVNGLHNLIWVYTVGDPAWYPGDDYVDIVGMDIYPDEPNTSLVGYWQDTQSRHEGVKLVTLSESGIVPDPDKIRQDNVWWNWFNVWSGEFIHDVDPAYLTSVYHDEDIITLDELIDWRHYPISSSPPTCSLTWPSNNIRIPENADLTLCAEAADTDGTVAKVEFFEGLNKLGEDSTTPYTCTWSHIPSGTYTFSAKATDSNDLSTDSADAALTVGTITLLETVRFEAEDAVSDGPSFKTRFPPYSGTGSMLFDGDGGTGLTFTVYSSIAGNYPLTIRYLIPAGSTDKPNRVYVNDQLIWTPTFLITNSLWTDFEFGDISLHAGSNTVRIEHFYGWMYVDYIDLDLPSSTPWPPGDLDMDLDVDIDDLAILAAGWTNPYLLEDMANISAEWMQ